MDNLLKYFNVFTSYSTNIIFLIIFLFLHFCFWHTCFHIMVCPNVKNIVMIIYNVEERIKKRYKYARSVYECIFCVTFIKYWKYFLTNNAFYCNVSYSFACECVRNVKTKKCGNVTRINFWRIKITRCQSTL